jgi:hypothetical protein
MFSSSIPTSTIVLSIVSSIMSVKYNVPWFVPYQKKSSEPSLQLWFDQSNCSLPTFSSIKLFPFHLHNSMTNKHCKFEQGPICNVTLWGQGGRSK